MAVDHEQSADWVVCSLVRCVWSGQASVGTGRVCNTTGTDSDVCFWLLGLVSLTLESLLYFTRVEGLQASDKIFAHHAAAEKG
jgi:hypothetical protein